MPTVVDSDIWRVELNPNQQHLGRTFVGLREHKSSISELVPEEVLELHRVMTTLEIGARAAFQPDLFNWLCLMNNAKRDSQEPHVHWHMVPRYRQPIVFDGHTFTDDAWPGQYNIGHDPIYKPSLDEIEAITNVIRKGASLTNL